MLNLLPSVLILGLAAFAAWFLAWRRRSGVESEAERNSAARMLSIAVVVQSVHFAEEALTGFHTRLPGLFNLPEIPLGAFLLFNLLWIGAWILSVPGLRSARPLAFFAAWFLAIAGMINGIAHPLLALASGGYFPGLWTSPIIGGVCVLLWRRLQKATHRRSSELL